MTTLPSSTSHAGGIVKRGVALAISLVYLVATRAMYMFVGRRHSQPVILTYHSIWPGDASAFEWQVRYLARSVPVIFVDDALDRGSQGVAVTFDDALSNVFENALPILARYGVPTMVFVPTGFLGVAPGWIDLARNPQRAAGTVVPADTLRALDRQLVRLGSHTVTHVKLDAVPLDTRRTELGKSKKDLEAIVGAPVRVLSLPYGRWSESVLSDARREGYRWVLTNVPVNSHPGFAPLVGRVDVSPRESKLEFRLKVAGAYGWMAVAVPAKRAALSFLRPAVQR